MRKLGKQVLEYFPYNSMRPYQEDFIKTIYEAVEIGKSAMIEGANGLGKTVAALSGCLPVAIEKNMKILYVARTHNQHDRVIEELSAISKRQTVSGVSVRGRHEMCLHSLVKGHRLETRGVMEICEMLKATGRCRYFANIENREDEYSETQNQMVLYPLHALAIRRICHRKGFCPYELVKSILPDVNVVALSYLYVFDPVIRSAFLKSLETSLDKTILVIDEAHNIPETAVTVASSSLSLFSIRQAENEAESFDHKDISGFARIIIEEMEKIAEKTPKQVRLPTTCFLELAKKEGIFEPQKFFEHIHDTGILIRRKLLLEGKFPRSFVYSLGHFMLKWAANASDYSFTSLLSKYATKHGETTAKLELVALDPAKTTAPVLSQTYSNIIISGTLQPMDAYAKMTKLAEDAVRCVIPSPFAAEHILPLIIKGTTTAMENRTHQMYRKILRKIYEVVDNTPANVGIFVPSFDVLNALLAEKLRERVTKPLFCEHRNMSSKENEEMISEFKNESKQGGAVLLGVQGGRSSEGVDFPGDEMNSVVVVGVPYAEPTPKVKAQIDYFERCFPAHGREFAYTIPAMKKASQAAGRPVRTLEDKGAVIFLDYRFALPHLSNLLPIWIRENLRILPDEEGCLAAELGGFFRKTQ